MHQQHLTSGETILVVDDTPADLHQLIDLLAIRGYQIYFATDASFAFASARAKQPDLILLNIRLPDFDGYAICRALKADPQTRNMPVIFLGRLAPDKVQAFTVGGSDYITKPFQAEEVLARIETQLNQRRLQNQLIEQNNRLQQEIAQREQAEQALEQQLQKMFLLRQVTETIRSQAESQQVFEAVVEQIGRVFQVNRCSIHIYVPPPLPEIPLVAEYVQPGTVSLRQMDFSLESDLLIPEVLAQDRAVAAADVDADPRMQPFRSFCHLTNIKSLLAVRTAYRSQANGMIMLQQCDQRHWSADEMVLLEAIAAQIGIALAQAKSVEQEQKQLAALGYQNLILRQEICQRRQIESALQTSEAELRSLFAAMVDVVLVLDRQGRYLKVAPTQDNLYLPASDLLGKTIHEVLPQQAEQFLGYIQESLETQQSLDCEYCLLIRQQEVWFSAKISPNSQDTVIWVARDITARKQTEAALSTFSSNLKHLHRLSLTDFATIEDLCADYLKTGCEILGFSTGVVGQTIGGIQRLLAVYSDLEFLVPGLEFAAQDVYCGAVLESRQTVYYKQVSQLDALLSHPMYQTFKAESYIGTPIWVDGEIYGTLGFFSTRTRSDHDHHEQEIIELMAQSIGKFISVHQVAAERQQAEEEVQLLLNITQAITAAPDFNQALYAALRALCEATGWIYGEAWLPAADGSVLECSPVWYCNQTGRNTAAVASVKRLRQSLESATFQPSQGIAGRVWSRQQPEWTLDEAGAANPTLIAGEHSQYRFQLVNHYGIKARLGVPITVTYDRVTRDRDLARGIPASHPTPPATVLAVLVFFTVEARQQDQHLIQLVSAVAAQLGTVLAQKQAEAELQTLFAAMNDVVLVRDSSGRCLKVASANPNFYQPVASLLGKTLHESLPPPIADRMLLGIRESLATGATVNLEYSLILNREVWLAVSISPLSPELVLIVIRDISERQQAEAALARRERYLTALVEVQRQLLAYREQTQYTAILQLLGQVSGASRVYLYENYRDVRGKQWVALQSEWRVAASVSAPALPPHLYEIGGERWAQILAKGEILSGTVTELPPPERRLLESHKILSILVLPLVVNGETWGFIGFDDCQNARAWDALEISLLRTAASAIALHHERKLSENALRLSAKREQAMLRVIERMRQTLEIEQIFRTTTEELRQLLKCDRVLIYCFNADWSGEVAAESVAKGWTSMLSDGNLSDAATVATDRCVVKNWGSQAGEQDRTSMAQNSYFQDTHLQETQGGAYRQGAKYLCVRDVDQAQFSACYLNLLHHLQAKAYLTVPIFQGNRLWGLLAAYQNAHPRDWQTAEINLAIHVSTQLGVALQQADLLAQTQRQSADLEKAKDAAETANRAKTQFLANMSHELRTPLNSILGFTQLIGQEATLSAEHRSYLNIVNCSGQHLLELINDVLEVAKLEADRASLQPSPFDLYSLLDNIKEMLRLVVAEKRLRLKFEIAAAVPQSIVADRSKLRQVLLNLLGNAIKFTQVGTVTLRVQEVASSYAAQTDHPSDESAEAVRVLCFTVEDTGFGIAAEEMDSLFEAFVQTEAGRQSNQGTGLGLTISRRFVQLMGGKLQVQSLLGSGSVFKFAVPVGLAAAVTSRTPALADSPAAMVEMGVNCIDENVAAPLAAKLIAADLAEMPTDWVVRLYQAASGCSDRQILQLIEQIPSAHVRLSQGLRELAYDFRFEEIVELTKSQI